MNPLDNIRVVLVRTIYGGNLGAVCRAMKNMGLSDLVLVNPNPDMDFYDAQKYALHAQDVLENRRQVASVPEAVADCSIVAATTGLKGLYRSHAKTPREWAPRLLESACTGRVALVFGPEHHGLSNEEMQYATLLITIPSSPAYPSLNLAQAVMICAYELFVASGQFQPPREIHPEAPVVMRERMLSLWREMLLTIGFCDEIKIDHMMMAFRRIFGRGYLSEADVNILMGLARQAMWSAKHTPQERRRSKAAAPAEPSS
ncbi:MAG: RNA methyltransferase [Kiritimatiellae bacterium]|nr:RNA methyltransferase [Kiritimatiellia bacterium]MDW8458813.1 RNA methyltransferase [Verrucomicrobiota bacterium]